METTRTGRSAATTDGSYVIPDTLLKDLRDSVDWYVTITRLKNALTMPDLTTRHGLKKVHKRFNELYNKLEYTYNVARRKNDQRAMGAVVGLMAKMCVDALLRDKLFEKGILNKIISLLDVAVTRYLALNALVLITHHGGTETRKEIALQNKILLKLVQDHPDDPRVAEGAITILDHVTEAVVDEEDPPSLALLEQAMVKTVLETIVATLRKPTASRKLLIHALSLLVCAPRHCPTECRSVPGLITLLVAFTRSKSIDIRALALSGLQRLAIRNHEQDAPPPPQPDRLMEAAARSPPDHLLDILHDYGTERGDLFLICESMAEYTQAMMRAQRDHDMYALGKKLARVIQQSEYVIGIQAADGHYERDGAPFVQWTDAFPLAAKALRDKGDLDDADIVQLKFFNFHKRFPESNSLAHVVIKRNPRLSYAYYALSLDDDQDTGETLRAVKKGLKCPDTTAFVRNQLLWRAISLAAERGLNILLERRKGDPAARSEASAFLVSAWEDAKTFITEAPPDSRHMLGVVGWYVLLTIVIRGPELSEDLSELDAARRKIKTSIDFMKFVGHTIRTTQVNIVRALLLTSYAASVREWGALVNRYDELDTDAVEEGPISPAQADDDLAQWLGNLDISEDATEENDGHDPCSYAGRRQWEQAITVEMGDHALYRCSWCGNPSAALRKCRSCGKTQYCDAGCQKSHWPMHKVDCKGR